MMLRQISDFIRLRIRIKLAIVVFIIASIFALMIGFMSQVKKIVNKGYITSVLVQSSFEDENFLKLYPITIKNLLGITRKIADGEQLISGTYYKKIYLGLKTKTGDPLGGHNLVISFHNKQFLLDHNNFEKYAVLDENPPFDYNSSNYDVYRLNKSISNNKSIFPLLNKIINWSGDGYLLLNFLFAFLFYFALFSLLLLGIAIFFSVTVLDADEYKYLPKEKREKYYIKFENMYKQNVSVRFVDKTGLFFYYFIKRLKLLFIKKDILIVFSVFLVLEVFDIIVIQMIGHFNVSSFYIVPFYINKVLFDWFLYLTVSMFFFKIVRTRIVGAIFSVFYIFVLTLDIALLLFGNTLFQKVHIKLTSAYSVLGFLSFSSAMLVGILVVISFISIFFLLKSVKYFKKRSVLQLLALLLFLICLNFPNLLINLQLSIPASGVKLFTLQEQKKQINYYTRNSFINFFEEILLGKFHNKIHITNDYSDYTKVIKNYGLSLGPKEYSSLNLDKFNKIIVFTTESFSLDFLSGYNNELPVSTSVYYDSPEIQKEMFLNYKTTAHNTLEGLTATYNSNPNAEALINESKNSSYFKNSLPNILKRNGYKTIFLRSASRYYAGENIYFKVLGFDQIIAREDFEHKFKKYISGWGVCDRIMNNRLVEILEKYKDTDKKIFISVIGTDTHLLKGRIDYKGLDYPPFPEGYDKLGEAKEYFESFYYHDYDMKILFETLKEKDLLGDDTLFVLTADHACPYNSMLSDIPGYPQESLIRIPLVFLTTQKLPVLEKNILASQVDLAPTLLHLLDIKVPDGYWGDSLFAADKKPYYVGYDRGVLYLEDNGTKYEIVKDDPKGQDEKDLIKLFNSLIIN